jgi:hypothetical protein
MTLTVTVSARHHQNALYTGVVNLGGGLADWDDLSSAWRAEGGAGLVGTGAPSYKGFRFPAEIISHCVWLYYRFSLSFRGAELRGSTGKRRPGRRF